MILVKCKFCGAMVPSDMIGVRWEKESYECCTLCCGVKMNKAEELKEYMEVDPDIVDDLLEYLSDKGMLSEKGERLRLEFWEMYIKEE